MNKYLSEFIGTFILVLIGCGSAVIAGDKIGILGIAIAFGFTLTALVYSIGPISGCHVNPAVSFGAFMADRLNLKDLLYYILSQCLGALIASGVLIIIVKGQIGGYNIFQNGLGQNGWGIDYLGGYNIVSAMLFEVIATFIFVMVILNSTHDRAPVGFAGLAIGITLMITNIVGIQITGASLNPARSLGPALFVGGTALSQLWLFLIFPTIGAILAGIFVKYFDKKLTEIIEIAD